MTSATFRSADAASRTLANPLTLTTGGTLGAPGTGDLTFTGEVVFGSGAKTVTVDNNTTNFAGPLNGTGAR